MFSNAQEFIDVDHSRLAYWRTGQGPHLVLIHGWPLHSGTYRNLLPHLQKHFTCHLIDLPGAGLTQTRERSAIALGRHTDTVLQAIDHLQLDRYAMVGHDSGGLVTRSIAAERPEQVSALVLGNTEVPGHISTLFKLFGIIGTTRVGQLMMGLSLRSKTLRKSPLLYGSCFDDPSHADGEFAEMFIEPGLRNPKIAKLQFEMVNNFDFDLIHSMGERQRDIRCPVQLIWGKDDPWFPLSGAVAMQKDLDHCELEVLDGKLFVHEERPDEFARLAIQFLNRTATDVGQGAHAA